jgi:hypothetical protein
MLEAASNLIVVCPWGKNQNSYLLRILQLTIAVWILVAGYL